MIREYLSIFKTLKAMDKAWPLSAMSLSTYYAPFFKKSALKALVP